MLIIHMDVGMLILDGWLSPASCFSLTSHFAGFSLCRVLRSCISSALRSASPGADSCCSRWRLPDLRCQQWCEAQESHKSSPRNSKGACGWRLCLWPCPQCVVVVAARRSGRGKCAEICACAWPRRWPRLSPCILVSLLIICSCFGLV